MRRIAVLGGGVAGVVMAQHLAARGTWEVVLIEKESRLGGLQHSVQLRGLTFDIGAFLFSSDHELLHTFPFLFDCFVPARPIAISLTPTGNVCPYPITVRSYLRDNGRLSLVRAIPDLLISRLRHRRRDTVPSFAKYLMGDQIYRQSGLKDYIERFYGLRDEEIGLEFALQRLGDIQDFTPTALARRALRRMLKSGRAASPTPTALVRPANGFRDVYSRIQASLIAQGVAVRLGCSVALVRQTPNGEYDITIDCQRERYDRVVSTVPIPVMLRLLGVDPAARFEHIALLSLFYRGKLRHDASYIYNFMSTGRWKRITVFSSFYGADNGMDYFTVEIATREPAPPNIDILRADFEDHAAHVCVPAVPLEFLGSAVTSKAYPLFRRGATEGLQRQRERLTEAGIDFIGRQGRFAYLSSDDVAREAAALAAVIE